MTSCPKPDPVVNFDREGRKRFPCLFGLHDMARLDTSHGANSPFAPRADWAPAPDEYIDALREYCRSPCGPRQVLESLARRAAGAGYGGIGSLPEIVGPYAAQLIQILSSFVKNHREGASAQSLMASSVHTKKNRVWRSQKRSPAPTTGVPV